MAEEQQLAAVALKLPTFWPMDPELWFKQVEAQFTLRNITQDITKYNHIIGSLSAETAAEVRDLLISPPDNDKYKALKDAIISRTTNSEQARLKQLLTAEDLEGRRPSQLLRRMRQLVGSNVALVSDDLLKQLFLPRLPTHVQVMLTANDTLDLNKMADLADKLMDVIGPQISAIAASGPQSDEVSELRKEINEIKHLLRGRQNDRGDKGNRSRSKTPAQRTADQTGLCWFHAKFGDKAKKCREPCSFNQGNANSSH